MWNSSSISECSWGRAFLHRPGYNVKGIRWWMQLFVCALCAVAKTNVRGSNKSGSVTIFMPFSLAHFIGKSQFTAPRALQIRNSLFCRSRWWYLHCNSEVLPSIPFSCDFFFPTLLHKKKKRKERQPASLSSGSTSSPLQWEWFLDWNCCYLQTCSAPDFSRWVSAALPHRATRTCCLPALSDGCWWNLRGKALRHQKVCLKSCFFSFLNFILISKGFMITNSLFKLPVVRGSGAL